MFILDTQTVYTHEYTTQFLNLYTMPPIPRLIFQAAALPYLTFCLDPDLLGG